MWELASRACCLLLTDQFEEAGECLGKVLERLQKFVGNPTLGLPRGADNGGEFYYAFLKEALWEFDRIGWLGLMECIAAGRGYSLGNYGRCLTYRVVDLSKADKRMARNELDWPGSG